MVLLQPLLDLPTFFPSSTSLLVSSLICSYTLLSVLLLPTPTETWIRVPALLIYYHVISLMTTHFLPSSPKDFDTSTFV